MNSGAGYEIKIQNQKVVSKRKTGWAKATGSKSRATFVTGSVTLPQLAERVAALIDDLYDHHGMIGQ